MNIVCLQKFVTMHYKYWIYSFWKYVSYFVFSGT